MICLMFLEILKISPNSHWAVSYKAWFDYLVFVREEAKMRQQAKIKEEKKDKTRGLGGKSRVEDDGVANKEKDEIEAIVDEEDYDTKAVMTLIGFRNK